MKLILIRHGLSEANEKRILSGHLDVSLSNTGISILKDLKSNINYPETDIYLTSHLKRTVETFDILFEDKTIKRKDERFSEINFGDYESKSFDDLDMDDFFSRLYLDEKISNVETISELYCRIEEGLIDLLKEMKNEGLESATILSHSTVIRTIVVKATNNSLDTFRNTRPKNGLGYILDVDIVENKIIYNDCFELK